MEGWMNKGKRIDIDGVYGWRDLGADSSSD
jgi:hypothetical protein